MKSCKRWISVLAMIAILVTCTVLPVAAADQTYADVPQGAWFTDHIETWSGRDIVEGYGDGTFKPDNEMTRAEFATVMVKTLGLTEKAENIFSDLKEGLWYTDAILKCVKADIMRGRLYGTELRADAEEPITRAEAFVMFARAMGIPEAENTDALKDFKDAKLVPDFAAGYISSLVELGVVSGMSETSKILEPNDNINRASVMALLDKAIPVYIDEPGTYDIENAAVVLIKTDGDVVLKGNAAVLVVPEDSKATVETTDFKYEVETNLSKDADVQNKHEYIVTKEATCGEAGEKVCSTCGDKIVIAATGKHTPVKVPGKAATCTETGLTDGEKCSVCGKMLVGQSVIPAKGHTPVTVTGKAATCTEKGLTDGKKCSVCDTVLVAQEEIAALGHEYKDGVCTRCGAVDPDAKVKEVKNEVELTAALANADIETIVLGDSFPVEVQVNVDRVVTINGNGKTVTSNNTSTDASSAAGILVTEGATIENLIVKGPNKTPSGWDSGEYGIKVFNTEAVTLKDVTVTEANGGIQVNSSGVKLGGTVNVTGNEFGGIEVCKSSDTSLSAGELNIGDATLVCEDTKVPAIWMDNVDQGTVTGTDSMNKLVRDQAGSKKTEVDYYLTVPENAEAKIGNVYYEKLADAIAAAEANGTVTLLKNVNVDAQINIDKALTFDGNGKTITATGNDPWSTSNSNGGFNIMNITAEATVSDLTLDSASKAWGLQAYCAGDVALNSVKLTNSKGSGLTVNGSTVTATALTTENNAWQGVNVDKGAGVTADTVFTLVSGELKETFQIKSDNGGVTVKIPEGYYHYQLGTVEVWSTKTLDEMVAILNSGEDTVVVAAVEESDADVIGLYASMDDALKADAKTVAVTMFADATLNANDAYLKLCGKDTTDIAIEGKNHKLTLTTTYWSRVNLTNPAGTLTLKNMTITSQQTSGTWNSYDVTFMCNVKLENVKFEKAVALDNPGKTSVLKNVAIAETNDYYALWIVAGGNVSIEDSSITSGGRSIKISDQYVAQTDRTETKLTVSGTTFTSVKKAAILVGSTAGATIALDNVDISKVAADKEHAVWVDNGNQTETGEKYSDYDGLVTVTGGQKIIEP